MGYFFIFYWGAIVGSFLLCLGEDWAENKLSLTRRSSCPSCGHVLGVWDLFPIFSQFFLKSRCRYCKKHYGSNHIISEIIVGIVFLAIALIRQNLLHIIVESILASSLITMSIIDLKARWAPDSLQALNLILILSLLYIEGSRPGIFNLVFGLLFILLGIFGSNLIGGADVKLIFCLSLIIPYDQLGIFLFIAASLGIVWHLFNRHNNQAIPFVPMLSASFLFLRIFL